MKKIFKCENFAVNGRTVTLTFSFDIANYSSQRMLFDYYALKTKVLGITPREVTELLTKKGGNNLVVNNLNEMTSNLKGNKNPLEISEALLVFVYYKTIGNEFRLKNEQEELKLIDKFVGLGNQINETIETDLEKNRLMSRMGVPRKEVAEKKCPNFGYFQQVTVAFLREMIVDLFKNTEMGSVIKPYSKDIGSQLGVDTGGVNYNIFVDIGNASFAGEENIAIVDEEKSDEFNLHLGFHGAYVGRYIVFPIYWSNGKTWFPRFLEKCIVHEMRHYIQIMEGRTPYEMKVDRRFSELVEAKTLPPTARILYYTLFELMKEAEAYLDESRKTTNRWLDTRWIEEFRLRLMFLINENKSYEELFAQYNKDIDEKEMLYFNGLIMIITVILAEAVRNKTEDDIECFSKSGTGRVPLNRINESIDRDGGFYIGKIPEKYIEIAFNRIKVKNIALFIKIYDESCKQLNLTKKMRVIDWDFYKKLWKEALEKDKKHSNDKLKAWGF
jgi:hypothetical protein